MRFAEDCSQERKEACDTSANGTVYHYLMIFCSLLSADARPCVTPTTSKISIENSSCYF